MLSLVAYIEHWVAGVSEQHMCTVLYNLGGLSPNSSTPLRFQKAVEILHPFYRLSCGDDHDLCLCNVRFSLPPTRKVNR